MKTRRAPITAPKKLLLDGHTKPHKRATVKQRQRPISSDRVMLLLSFALDNLQEVVELLRAEGRP